MRRKIGKKSWRAKTGEREVENDRTERMAP
jgi:hypothetical protein